MNHLTPLMAVLGHHVYLVGRPRQGQHAIAVSRSPGEGQGHRGQKNFFQGQKFFFNFLCILDIFKQKKFFPYQHPKKLRKILPNFQEKI